MELNYACSDAYKFALSWFEVFSPFSPPRRGRIKEGVLPVGAFCFHRRRITPILIFPVEGGRKFPELPRTLR